MSELVERMRSELHTYQRFGKATCEEALARIEALERELAEAVAVERERCAGIAEHYNFGPERTERDNARNSIAQIIAAAIRSGDDDGLR